MLFYVPFSRSPTFVPRADLVRHIHRKLDSLNHVVITGGGGIGKSQLALDFCYRLKHESPNALVLWVQAGSPARIQQGFQAIAKSLSIPAQIHTALRLVLRHLDRISDRRWLLVLNDLELGMFKDGADLPILKAAGAGESPTCIFQNSSSPVLEQILNTCLIREESTLVMDVPKLDVLVAMWRFKLPGTTWGEIDLEKLVRALDSSPLAVGLAAAYIGQNKMSSVQYLEELMTPDLDLAEVITKTGTAQQHIYSASLVRVFLLSIKQVELEIPQAIALLSLASVFDRQEIPESLLFSKNDDVKLFQRAIRRLVEYGLIFPTKSLGVYSVHRLLHHILQLRLENQMAVGFWKKKALTQLSERFGGNDQSYWRNCDALSPHAFRALGYDLQDSLPFPHCQLLQRMAAYDERRGLYNSAFCRFMEAHAIFVKEDVLGPKHRRSLAVAGKAAGMLAQEGKTQEAEDMMRNILIDMNESLGPDDPDTVTAGNTLAMVLSEQGKYAEAEELYRKALTANIETRFGSHFDSLTIKSNLAMLLAKQGRYVEAETLHRQALAGRIKEHGREHPDSLQCTTNLTVLLSSLGRDKEAEELNREALPISQRVLGSEHPDTLNIVNNLAVELSNLGRYTESERMHRRVILTRQKIFGLKFAKTIESKQNLAIVLDKQGRYEEAQKEFEEALEASKTLSDDNHPSRLNLLSSLGLIYLKQKKYAEAEPIMKTSLLQREKILGPGHQQTLVSKNNLAGLLQRQGKYEESEALHREILAAATKSLGPDHPFTLRSTNNVAEVLRESKHFLGESETLMRRAVRGRERELGMDHPDTLTSVYNLARVIHDLERYDEARPLYVRAKLGMEKALGLEHPATKDCVKNLKLMEEEERQTAGHHLEKRIENLRI